MKRFSCVTVLVVLVLVVAQTANAQITVQQPVVSTFSVATTVSVPDSGAGFLGGVSRAGASRSSYGPFRSGTSSGFFRQNAAASTKAWIHDLASMDERLLQSRSSKSAGPPLTGYARHAYSTLTSRRYATRPDSVVSRKLVAYRSIPTSASAAIKPQPKRNRKNLKADRSYRLGLQAVERGKTGLAKLHFKTAAKLGSALAKEKLTSFQ